VVYENGRRPAGVRLADGDDGCRVLKGRTKRHDARQGQPMCGVNPDDGGKTTAGMCKGLVRDPVSKWELENCCAARSSCPAV